MSFLTLVIYLMMGVTVDEAIELFTFDKLESSKKWQTVNDGVMGGISTSRFMVNANGTATFSGILSPENNGGFASVRALISEVISPHFEYVLIRVKGDGKQYSLRFRTNQNFDGVAYQVKFKTKTDKWEEIQIPFRDFNATFRGRKVSNQPRLTPQKIEQIGLLISDKQFGSFILEIDWIKLY